MTKPKLELKEKIAIEKKIEELKQEWKNLTTSKIGKMYQVLTKYVALKKQLNPKFAIRSLEREKDLQLKEYHIRYIFSYAYVSDFSKRLVEKGEINDSVLCFLINKSSLFREPQWQNRAVKMYLEGKVSISQLGELKLSDTKNFLLGKIKLGMDDAYLLSATKTLRSMLSRLNKHKHLINKSQWKDNLIAASQNINKLLKECK